MKSWAFVVGINVYPPNAKQAPLKGAVADAVDFADWALHPDGGAVPPERLYLWTHPAPQSLPVSVNKYLTGTPRPPLWWDPDADPPGMPADFRRAPTQVNVVETALGAGAAISADRLQNPGDTEVRRCYVFFAGHGVQSNVTGSAADTQTCFLLGDFRPLAQTVMGLIPCEDFKRALLNSGFDEVFMFLDCCRISLTKLNMPAPVIGSANTRVLPSPTWGVGSAAQKDKPAFETVGPPVRGAFSQTLLQGLRSVRDPQTQELSLESLKLFVRDNLPAACAPNEQRASFTGNPDEPLPSVVTGPPIPTPEFVADIRVDFGTLPAGTPVQLVDDKGAPVGAPLIAGPGGATIPAVAGGFYSLDVAVPRISKAFRHPGPAGVTDVAF
jgi:hypothetical protein